MTGVLPLFATCPKGLELLLRDELAALGAVDARESLAGVRFGGTLETAYRACVWSRLASRILLPIAEFDAPDDPGLYAGVRAIDWDSHLAPEDTFAVDAAGTNAALRNTTYIAQRVKDAIADGFRERHGLRPTIDRGRPSIRLNVRLHRDRATVSIDLIGAPLHRRGWRTAQGIAPLKENLACAMLLRAGWPEVFAAGGALVDPMCGSGTLVIEAALMVADVAPGLARGEDGFSRWRGGDSALVHGLLAEAGERAVAGRAKLPAVFHGFDADANIVVVARANAERAGIAGQVSIECRDVGSLHKPAGCGGTGLVIANPPYGRRLSPDRSPAPLYRELGDRLRAGFPGWRAAVITDDDDLGRAIGLRASRRYVLFNGALECRLLVFAEILPAEATNPAGRPLPPAALPVVNRITKTRRHFRRRLAAEGIGCWRAYDADIPEYAAAVDVYTAIGRERVQAGGEVAMDSGDFPQTWLHVQEYAPPAEIPDAVARERLRGLIGAAGEVFAVPRERIAVKTRRRARGGSQYGRLAARDEFLIVEEGGLRFRVNLFDRLDTGLFLDHRPLRARLRIESRGKRFLNLFCYTGSLSVAAAAGGAAGTTSVDLSANYLEWAERNFALNGLAGPRHRLVQADAMAWLAGERAEFDLICIDPPTFSNSSRAGDFDVQRDHARLVSAAAARLAPAGTIFFSNNARRFRLDAEGLANLAVRDVTAATIPFDFTRRAHVHRCWEIKRPDPA